jgi:hypothetical protein
MTIWPPHLQLSISPCVSAIPVGIKTAVLPTGYESAVTPAYLVRQTDSPFEFGENTSSPCPAPESADFSSVSRKGSGYLA